MSYNNEMSKGEFIVQHLIWIVISMLWYRKLLFRCIEKHSFHSSGLILWGMLAVCSIGGMCFHIKKGRNSFHTFLNIVFGYGLYTVFAYIKVNRKMILFVLKVSTFLALVYSVLMMCRKIRKKKRFWKIIHRRIEKMVSAVQIIYGLGLAMTMLIIVINVYWSSVIMQSTKDTATSETINEQTISNHIDSILKLQETTWKDLSVQEKLTVLQTVANIEQRYLGLPNELNIRARNLRENLLGYYDDSTHGIVISLDSLLEDSSTKVLNTVCHEAYHSYQMRLVDAYNCLDEQNQNLKIFKKLKLYKNEFYYYISGEENFYDYYMQDCESDARDYAQEAVNNYIQRMEEYLKEVQEEQAALLD